MTCHPVFLAGMVAGVCALYGVGSASAQTYKYAKQGYSMRLCFDNRGAFGRTSYPGVIIGIDPGPDSIGLEYPLGQPFEHIFGGGLWVGGILDTSAGPVPSYVHAVTVAYEGWVGPYFEFYPGSSTADSIWEVQGRGVPRPSGWDAYWGNLIPGVSFSDNDRYCLYNDFSVRVVNHVPLRLKVAQSCYAWNVSYAEGMSIIQYKIVNTGVKEIDSAYVGMFLDADVGPYRVSNFSHRNYAAYDPDERIAYIHNPVDIGSTPVGITLLDASSPIASLRNAFRWWPGSGGPDSDRAKYQCLASGITDSNQSSANLSDARCLISFGPFTLHPVADPHPDTVTVVFGIVSGQSLNAMRLHAERARMIYFNGGLAAMNEQQTLVPTRFELFQNYPNPFNPTTTIRFTIPPGTSGRTSLRVFDLLGREVATLVEGVEEPGEKAVRFDMGTLPSGVYFYRLESGTFVETRKLIILR